RSAVDLQPSINFQTPVENLGPLLETPGTTIPVGAGGLHFISGARRGMNELRLQGRPTVRFDCLDITSFPHHVGSTKGNQMFTIKMMIWTERVDSVMS